MLTPRLWYVNVFVSDLARAVEFYRDTLGLPLQFHAVGSGPRMATRIRVAIAVPALVMGMGCDPGSHSGPAPARCEEAGVQCQLPEGPLGVCERTTCATAATPPCFVCVPQH